MASLYTLINFLVLFTSLLLKPSSLNALKPIEQVCPQTSNPPFCFQVLNSDGNAAHATDVAGLGHPAIDNAQSLVGQAMQVTNDLIGITDDPTLKDNYQKCLGFFKNTCSILRDCRSLFISGAYMDMLTFANIAIAEAKNCDQLFRGNEPDRLKQHNKDVQDLCDVVKVVANILYVG